MTADTLVRRPSIALMTLIAMASPLALNLFVPAMPDAARELQTDVGVIQLSFTAYLFTLAFGQPVATDQQQWTALRQTLTTAFSDVSAKVSGKVA
jgi:MFS family permease